MKYRYRRVLHRRTLLRGAGTVAIGLPLLDPMLRRSVFAAEPEPPVRAITLFFGEGVPVHIQQDHLGSLDGPFEPLAPFDAKLARIRGLSFPGTHHVGGGMGAFTGVRQVSDDQAGGPSVDQVLLQESYPDGPPTLIPTLGAGVYGSYRAPPDGNPDANGLFRRVKSWRNNGTPSVTPKDKPRELFTSIFGTAPGTDPPDPNAELSSRMRRSVLDSVMDSYRHYMSDASNLGRASRARIDEHFQRIREYERRAFSPDMMLPTRTAGCEDATAPEDPDLFRGQRSFNGVNLTVDDLTRVWRMNADLLALALQCDITRFGWGSFLTVGDRIDLRGEYSYEGRTVYDFNDSRDHQGSRPEGQAVNHEWFHQWNSRGQPGERLGMHHLHFYMREVAYFLGKLDDPAYTDPNGGTLLDNAMIMITTELSNPGPHSTDNVVHFLGSANERFQTGSAFDVGTRPAADMYNTVLRAYGHSRTMANNDFESEVTQVRR